MNRCLICDTNIRPFMSFSNMPIANGFLTRHEFENEYFFDMSVAYCQTCGMFQLLEQPKKEKMFNENYAFFSGTSRNMAVHFKNFADHALKNYLRSSDPFVVEVGSNDGILLKHFRDRNIRHLGIEPSANVAQVAIDNSINTLCQFFDKCCAEKIVREYGQADIFLGANVMCHIPYIHSVVEGIKILLKPEGIVMFEDPYLGDVIENTLYDQIYDEHVFLFSVSSIQYLFEQHDMELIDIEPQHTHGGSMRYVIANKGKYLISPKVFKQYKKEELLKLQRPETYTKFQNNCEYSRNKLLKLITDLREQDKRIVGYAATSKSTTIINYCGITTDQIEYISDTTPLKQGKYSPGAHIPIHSHKKFAADYPDYSILFAYNHAQEIMAKEMDYIKSGGKWIVYVPDVQVLK